VQSPVVIFTNDTRGDLSGFNCDGLINNAFLFSVISHLHMTRQWEVFSEGVTNKSVVGQNSAEVFMSLKDHSV